MKVQYGTTFRHPLRDTAQSAIAVLSDEDLEHSRSVRLLDVLVNGLTSRRKYPLADIPDVVNLTLMHGCRCGYGHCRSIEVAVTRNLLQSAT